MQWVEAAITAPYFFALCHQDLAIAATYRVNDLRSLANAHAYVCQFPRRVRSTASSVYFHRIVCRLGAPSAVTRPAGIDFIGCADYSNHQRTATLERGAGAFR